MSSISITLPTTTVTIPVGRQSRVVFILPEIPLVGFVSGATDHVSGSGVGCNGPSHAYGEMGGQSMDYVFDNDLGRRYEYSSIVPGSTDNAGTGSLPQITGLAISGGNLTVTRTGGSDVLPVLGLSLLVRRSPTDGPNSADRSVALTGATAASWTP